MDGREKNRAPFTQSPPHISPGGDSVGEEEELMVVVTKREALFCLNVILFFLPLSCPTVGGGA